MANKRRKLSRRGSKKYFTATAQKVHRRNRIGGVMVGPMRGGIRL